MKKFKEINDKNDPKMPLSLKNYILLLAGLIDFSDRRKPGCNPRFPDTEISPRTVKWKPFKLSSWASSRV